MATEAIVLKAAGTPFLAAGKAGTSGKGAAAAGKVALPRRVRRQQERLALAGKPEWLQAR